MKTFINILIGFVAGIVILLIVAGAIRCRFTGKTLKSTQRHVV